MYVPHEFACDEPTALAMIDAFPFALLVIPDLDAAHVPLVRRGSVLLGHVARASSLSRAIETRSAALAVFAGPHAFVSPRTYVSPRQVPTWNYVTTHVHGRLEPIASVDGAVEVLRALSRAFDPAWDGRRGARALGAERRARERRGDAGRRAALGDVAQFAGAQKSAGSSGTPCASSRRRP